MACSRGVVLCVLLLALASTVFAGDGVKYRQFHKNLKGVMQVAHVPSLSEHKWNKVRSADDCEHKCASVVGCNAWVYCDRHDGCGTSCQKYLEANPVLNLKKKVEFADFIHPGPFAKLCMGKAWTHGLCSLKYEEHPANPEFWPKTTGGFISGTIELPKKCKGVSARTCKRCAKAKNPKKCLECAKRSNKVQGDTANINRLLNKGGKVLSDNCR